MEIQTGMALFKLLDQSLGLFKKARDVMPESEEKQELTKKLQEVETAYKLAEAKAAKDLGFELCQCSWPPQIMLTGRDGRAECSTCHRKAGQESPAEASLPSQPRADGLPKEAIEILKILSQGGRNRPTAAELAASLNIQVQKTIYFLELLIEQELADRHLFVSRPSEWYLTKGGRKLLVDRGLL